MRFLWCAVPGPMTSDAQPEAVSLSVQMVGPFLSFAAAKTASRVVAGHDDGTTPPPAVPPVVAPTVASASPLRTDTWAGQDLTSVMVLTATLAAGFYLFEARQQVAVVPGADGGQTPGFASLGIIQITPP